MDIITEIKHMKNNDDLDLNKKKSHAMELDAKSYFELNSQQNTDKSNIDLKCPTMKKPGNAEKQKYNSSVGNRCMYQRKYFRPPAAKRKSAPAASIRMSNPSAEVVLRERKVEIKDLESQVVYLQSQIKELKAENKTLVDVQNRQEKELRKFKEGVADIPALLRSHKDEMKAVESGACSLRREIRVCQKELKVKSDVILRKDQQLDKLNHSLKRFEKNLQEVNIINRELKTENKKLEEESKKLLSENEELKSKNERMQKKIQQMTNTVLNLEETVGTTEHHKAQLKDDLCKLQQKYDESVEIETALKKSLHAPKVTSSTQTECPTNASVSCMTSSMHSLQITPPQKVSVEVQVGPMFQCSVSELRDKLRSSENNLVNEEEHCLATTSKSQDIATDVFPFSFCCTEFSNCKPASRMQKAMFLKPMHSTSSLSQKFLKEKTGSILGEEYAILDSHSPSNNIQFFSKESSFKKALKKSHVSKSLSFRSNSVTQKGMQDEFRIGFLDSDKNKQYYNNKNQNNVFSNFTVQQNCDKSEWLGS